MVNIRAKGASAEREVAEMLNLVLNSCRLELGLAIPPKPTVQRNQNQSAVGGCDLVGTFHFAIEVKRHETLSLNTWWNQCVKSASEISGAVPVLIFKQSHKPWRVLIPAWIPTYCETHIQARSEIHIDDFLKAFRAVAMSGFKHGSFE